MERVDIERVVPVLAVEHIGARAAVDVIVAVAGIDQIIAVATAETVAVRATRKGIVARATVQRNVRAPAENGVVVDGLACIEGIVAVTPLPAHVAIEVLHHQDIVAIAEPDRNVNVLVLIAVAEADARNGDLVSTTVGADVDVFDVVVHLGLPLISAIDEADISAGVGRRQRRREGVVAAAAGDIEGIPPMPDGDNREHRARLELLNEGLGSRRQFLIRTLHDKAPSSR